MRALLLAFVACVVVGSVCPVRAAEHTIRYSPDGALLEPLPQLKRKDSVTFRIVGVEEYGASEGRIFELRFRCGGDGVPWSQVLFETAGVDDVEASTGETCVGARWLSWEILSSTRAERDIQSVLHPTVEAYLLIGGLADRALETGVYGLSDDSWARLQGAQERANAYVADLPEEGLYSTEVRQALRQVVAPVGFDEQTAALPPQDRTHWERLRNSAYAAFIPYQQFVDRGTAEIAQNEAAIATAEGEMELLSAQLIRWDFQIADTPMVEDLPGLFEEKRAIEGLLAEKEASVAEWTARIDSWTTAPARAVYPVEWRAAGELPMGWRERVISVDPETHRFQQNDVAIDDHDRAWLALANVTGTWTLTQLTQEPASDGGASTDVLVMTSRGKGDESLPEILLKDEEPTHRVVLRELGRRRGHHQVAFTAESIDGELSYEGTYYVRRTYHVAFKQGAALSYVPSRSLEFVTGEDGQQLYQGGVPVTMSTRSDYEPEPLFGLAFYLHPHDLMDDLRRPPWMRAMPHLFVGWAPTDILRGYLGLGFEPFTGFSIEGGVALGPSKALRPPAEGYEWTVDDVFSVGWFVAFCTDASVFTKLFSKVTYLQ